MILINKNLLIINELEKSISKDIEEFMNGINEPINRVANTGQTYRTINSLTMSEMLPDHRKNSRDWRLFSFKDILYLSLIYECRKYGLDNKKLKMLHDDFYNLKANIAGKKFTVGEIAILLVVTGYKVTLSINEEGSSFFTDLINYIKINDYLKNYLKIDFNSIFEKIWYQHTEGKVKLPPYMNEIDLLTTPRMNQRDKEMFEIIKNEEYTQITITKKKDGHLLVVGEKSIDGVKLTPEDLVEVLDGQRFGNINIHKRNGEIESLRLSEVYKI